MLHISTYRRHVDPADKDSCAPGQAPTRSDQHEMQDSEKASDVILSEDAATCFEQFDYWLARMCISPVAHTQYGRHR